MRRSIVLTIIALSCQASPLPEVVSGSRIVITLSGANNVGTPGNPLPINFDPSSAYTFDMKMIGADGNVDVGFSSYVRISSKPGTVFSVDAGKYGRNVLMVNGVATGVQVTVMAAFGETRVWADDVGYVPIDNLARQPPPQCADGIDNNGDGLVDYPADPQCFAANDDTEGSSPEHPRGQATGATGVSDVIFYALPRIADVRGGKTNFGTGTPFPNDQVTIDTGYDLPNNAFKWDTVITGLASDGFFVTDLQDATNDPQKGLGYASVFAYTFSAPTKIGVCDRLRLLQGTSSDFFGYTELNFPTWAVEYWDPKVRPCLVPEPLLLKISDWTNAPLLFNNESGLVRLQAGGNVTLHVGAHFGPAHPSPPTYAPTATATNCDLSNHGKVNFSNPADAACAAACTADSECTEFAQYLSNGGFTIVMTDGTSTAKTQGAATAATSFDPVAHAGQQIGSFTGLVRYFSGGSQFTIQARCDDDVIANPQGTPFDSAHSCVNQNGNNPEQQP